MRRTILVNSLSAESGGALTYVRNLFPLLAEYSAPAGVEVIVLHRASQAKIVQNVNCERISVPDEKVFGYKRVSWEMINLRRLVKNSGANVVFTPYQVALPSIRVRSILMLRNMEPFLFSRYKYELKTAARNFALARWSAFSLRRASKVIAVSDYAKTFAVSQLHIPEEQVVRIYHGRDQSFSGEPRERDDDALLGAFQITQPFILSAGSMLPFRRYEDVVSAFVSGIAAKYPDINLVIAGDGSDRQYKAYIRQMACRSDYAARIRLVGHVNRDIMRALFRRCSAFVTATEIEACPNIAIEALASGSAVVATDLPPMPEILGDAYLRYRARDVLHLATALERLLGDDRTRAELTEKGRQRAAMFSWDTCAKSTFDLLTQQ